MRPSFHDLLGGITRQSSTLRADDQPPYGADLSHFSRKTEAGLATRSLSLGDKDTVLPCFVAAQPC